MRIKRICCFCEKWESGGIESFIFNVLTHMDMTGLEVDIVASCIEDSVFTERLEKIGVHFRQLSGNQKNVIRNWKMFKDILSERRYDVVHLNIFQGLSLRYAKLAEQFNVPVRIAHSHNTDLRSSLTKQLKLIIHSASKKLWSKYSTCNWACSEAAALFMFENDSAAGVNYTFIPNGIDTCRFKFSDSRRCEVRKKLGFTDEYVIGNVGRLCEQKNQMFLLDVFGAFHEKNSSSCLILVGEGELLEDLRKKADDMGIADSVYFYGVSEHVEQLLCAMDVFVFPSVFEGLGIVAVEAQASGLPAVCSENVPDEACVTDRFIRLRLTDGADMWAERIEELLSAYGRERYSEIVRQAGFDVRDVSENIHGKYAE